jgi:CubicO group peptidase (beta-lactamase class C family)
MLGACTPATARPGCFFRVRVGMDLCRVDIHSFMARLRSSLTVLALMTVTGACSAPREPVAPPPSPQVSAAPTPTPAVRPTEAALRAQLESVTARGEADYDRLVPALAEMIRSRPGAGKAAAALGPVRSVAFVQESQGVDVYEVTYEQGFARWRIGLGPDGKVAILRFQPLAKPAAPLANAEPTAPLADAELAAALDARIAAEGDAFSGVVLVARGGVPIYQKAVGPADREQGRANTLGTRFRVASLTKMFTAVAVLQLVQAGKVRLDAPLGTYLTDYPNQDIARKVTIHHLLTHTGGTGDAVGPVLAGQRGRMPSLQDYVAKNGARAPLFEPGSRWDYSNYGYVLLGRVIERVSGQSYYDTIEKRVFAPAGMTHSDFGSIDDAGGERAIGYVRAPGAAPGATLVPNTSILPYRGTSAGGAYSTVGDLLAFANAIETHRLLDEKHTELLTTGKALTPDGGRYAYGFYDSTLSGLRCIGHGGGLPGTSGQLKICRTPGAASSEVVAVLSNLDPPAGKDLMRFIRASFSRGSVVPSASVESGSSIDQ